MKNKKNNGQLSLFDGADILLKSSNVTAKKRGSNGQITATPIRPVHSTTPPVSSASDTKSKAKRLDKTDAVKAITQWLLNGYELHHLGWWSRFRTVVDLWFYALGRDDENYLRCVEELGRKAVYKASEMLGRMAVDMNLDPRDILGRVYQEIGANDRRHFAQYFTPSTVADCMAQMTLANLKKAVFDKPGGLRIYEPCVGSGTMVLAALRHIYSLFGHYGVERTHVTLIDKDPTCCKMASIQLMVSPFALLGATVYCGDALGSEDELDLLCTLTKGGNDASTDICLQNSFADVSAMSS